MWKEVKKSNGTSKSLDPPSDAEITSAFEIIVKYSALPPFCLFIDGLDEYVGDIRCGISFIRRLACNPRTKIVVSSRPIPLCVTHFDRFPKLTLQDLNRGDIDTYVRDVIGGNAYMEKLQQSHPVQSKQVMADIVEKSSGVFIWVVVACRSLLNGFDAFDNLYELQHRVDELPPELEDMFQLMLSKVDRRHRKQCARLLRFCYMYQKSRSANERPFSPLYSLGVTFVSDRSEMEMGSYYEKHSNAAKQKICEDLSGRLRSRCGGLLEVVPQVVKKWGGNTCFCDVSEYEPYDARSHAAWVDSEVHFMHRTVYEFLENSDVWQLDSLRLSDDASQLAKAMSLYNLRLAAVHRHSGHMELYEYADWYYQMIYRGLEWSVKATRNTPKDRDHVIQNGTVSDLRDLHEPRSAHELWGEFLHNLYGTHGSVEPHGIGPGPFPRAALVIGVEVGAIGYVRAHPDLPSLAAGSSPSQGYLPLLCHAQRRVALFRPYRETYEWWPDKQFEMVWLLLAAGCNPNAASEEGTPWAIWLKDAINTKKGEISLGLLDLFLRNGAALNSHRARNVRFIFDERNLGDKRRDIRQVWDLYQRARRLQGLDPEIELPLSLSDHGGL